MTNLIFADHNRLSNENQLLQLQVENYKTIIENQTIIDSLYNNQISLVTKRLNEQQERNAEMHKTLVVQQYVTGTSLFVTVLLTILCLIK